MKTHRFHVFFSACIIYFYINCFDLFAALEGFFIELLTGGKEVALEGFS